MRWRSAPVRCCWWIYAKESGLTTATEDLRYLLTEPSCPDCIFPQLSSVHPRDDWSSQTPWIDQVTSSLDSPGLRAEESSHTRTLQGLGPLTLGQCNTLLKVSLSCTPKIHTVGIIKLPLDCLYEFLIPSTLGFAHPFQLSVCLVLSVSEETFIKFDCILWCVRIYSRQ